MATTFSGRRLLALGVSATIGMFGAAAVTSPAFASSKGHTTTTKKKNKKKTTSKKKKTTTTTSGGSSSSITAELKALATKVKGQKSAVFEATYTLTNASTTKTLTLAQDGTKEYFGTTNGSIVDNGTATYYCSTGGGTSSTGTGGGSASGTTCIKSSAADPLASLVDLFSATNATTFFTQAEAYAKAKAAGATITSSSGTYAGLPSTCVTVKDAQYSGKFCVANIGILDYFIATNGESGTMTKYTKTIPAGTFTTPAGATVVTETAAA